MIVAFRAYVHDALGLWVAEIDGVHHEYAVNDGERWFATCRHNLFGEPPGGGCEDELLEDPDDIAELRHAVNVALWRLGQVLLVELDDDVMTADDAAPDPFPVELDGAAHEADEREPEPFPIELDGSQP